MKRTCFVLVSLLAITLLSCSALDNSAEDVNYPQANALNKANASNKTNALNKAPLATATAAATTGSYKLTTSNSWHVAYVSVGSYAWSNELYFNFTTPPKGCTITNITFCPGAVSVNKGAFTTSYLEISNDDYYTLINWNGSGCASTTTLNGEPAKSPFYAAFYGKCTGGYYEAGVYVDKCNKSYSGGNMTISYQCP